MEVKEYQGKTLGDAITEACADLGITSDKLKYETVQEGNNGFLGLGIGAKKYIIRVSSGNKENEAAPKSQARAEFKKERSSEKKSEAFDKQDSSGKPRDNKNNAAKTNAAAPKNTAAIASAATVSETNAAPKTIAAEQTEVSEANAADSSKKSEDRAEGRRWSDKKQFDNKRRNGRNSSNGRDGGRENGRDNNRDNSRRQGRNSGRRDNAENRAAAQSERRFSHGGYAESTETGDARDKQQRSDSSPKKYEKTGTVTGDPVKAAEEFLTSLFKSMEMNISYKGEFKPENNELIVDLSGEDMGVLIGKRGQTLDALQYLTGQVVNKHETAYVRVKIDTENYRERRRETMETLAQNIAQKVKRTHKPVALEPMNPYERRIIHSILQNEKDVITRSEGVEPYRHVIVCPAKKRRDRNERIANDAARASVIPGDEPSAEQNINEQPVAAELVQETIITEEINITAAVNEESSET